MWSRDAFPVFGSCPENWSWQAGTVGHVSLLGLLAAASIKIEIDKSAKKEGNIIFSMLV